MIKICNQRLIYFLRDYWLGLIIFILVAFALPSVENYIVDFVIANSSNELRPILVLLGIIAYILGIWETWNRVIGKKPSITFN